MSLTQRVCMSLLLAALALSGCGDSGNSGGYGALPPADDETKALAAELGMPVDEVQKKKQMLRYAGLKPDEIEKTLRMGGDASSLFKDEVASNVEPPQDIDQLVFFRSDRDKTVKLTDYIGKKNLVLVFTRGYSGGMLCPFCTTQTAQLAASSQAFKDRDAVVLIIYPGSAENLPEFLEAVSDENREKADVEAVEWPVLLDKDLTAVNLLDIAADLAKPSSFIIDKQGNIVFSYVGANRTDRPSVQALLDQLDAI